MSERITVVKPGQTWWFQEAWLKVERVVPDFEGEPVAYGSSNTHFGGITTMHLEKSWTLESPASHGLARCTQCDRYWPRLDVGADGVCDECGKARKHEECRSKTKALLAAGQWLRGEKNDCDSGRMVRIQTPVVQSVGARHERGVVDKEDLIRQTQDLPPIGSRWRTPPSERVPTGGVPFEVIGHEPPFVRARWETGADDVVSPSWLARECVRLPDGETLAPPHPAAPRLGQVWNVPSSENMGPGLGPCELVGWMPVGEQHGMRSWRLWWRTPDRALHEWDVTHRADEGFTLSAGFVSGPTSIPTPQEALREVQLSARLLRPNGVTERQWDVVLAGCTEHAARQSEADPDLRVRTFALLARQRAENVQRYLAGAGPYVAEQHGVYCYLRSLKETS